MFYEECKTPYEYIKKAVLSNRGTDSIVKKAELLRICKMLDINDIGENSSKEAMVDALTKELGVKGFAEVFYHNGLGISSFEYQQKYQISGKDVKRMERLGFIHCVGLKEFRKYGKKLKAPVYDVFEFYSLTPEKVKWFLNVNPKGTRKTQARYDYITL